MGTAPRPRPPAATHAQAQGPGRPGRLQLVWGGAALQSHGHEPCCPGRAFEKDASPLFFSDRSVERGRPRFSKGPRSLRSLQKPVPLPSPPPPPRHMALDPPASVAAPIGALGCFRGAVPWLRHKVDERSNGRRLLQASGAGWDATRRGGVSGDSTRRLDLDPAGPDSPIPFTLASPRRSRVSSRAASQRRVTLTHCTSRSTHHTSYIAHPAPSSPRPRTYLRTVYYYHCQQLSLAVGSVSRSRCHACPGAAQASHSSQQKRPRAAQLPSQIASSPPLPAYPQPQGAARQVGT
ncbi:hypothetical protein G7046_g303 [Stylonectria norvegica]|nr:hypothetical protein G7046_g303 [Stylonectria norvegica]